MNWAAHHLRNPVFLQQNGCSFQEPQSYLYHIYKLETGQAFSGLNPNLPPCHGFYLHRRCEEVGKPSIVTFNTILSAACRDAAETADPEADPVERWFRRCEDGSSPRRGQVERW